MNEKTENNNRDFSEIINQKEQSTMTHVSTESLLKITGYLSPEQLEFCKKKTQQMIELSPKVFAKVFTSLVIVDLKTWEKEGCKVGRLRMNRIPKLKSINALIETILKIGAQVMCIVIPARIATYLGAEVEDFDGNLIPENQLDKTLIVIDGQNRYSAIKKIKEEYPDKNIPELYAYFPLHWVELSELLQAINLKVFTWSNSDFMTGVLANGNVKEEVKGTLKQIQLLEGKKYNYTAACEWITLTKGIIRKSPLVKAMDSEEPELNFGCAEFGCEIYEAAKNKFMAKNESALKTKTMPEFIIERWTKACKDLSQKEATKFVISFLNQLNDAEVTEIVSPSEYKRGCGKKKESFVKSQLEKSFKEFTKSNPYENFKGIC